MQQRFKGLRISLGTSAGIRAREHGVLRLPNSACGGFYANETSFYFYFYILFLFFIFYLG